MTSTIGSFVANGSASTLVRIVLHATLIRALTFEDTRPWTEEELVALILEADR